MKNESKQNQTISNLEQFQRLADEQESSHFEDLNIVPTCNDPGHEPPTHLHIPTGKKYIHICPKCRRRLELIPPQIKF